MQTVFLSSHQIQEVERVADWVAILHQGKLQITAPLEDLKSSITLLNFAMKDSLLALPDELASGDTLAITQSGRTVQIMIRNMPPSILESLRQDRNLFDIKAVRPNLEELYIGFTQSRSSDLPTTRNLFLSQAI